MRPQAWEPSDERGVVRNSPARRAVRGDLHWLPDGSGFLYSNQTLMRDTANIFRYDYNTHKTTEITRLENEFTGSFSISPDGNWIVFERSKSLEDNRDIDLWIVGIDGRNARLLARNAFSPSWR